MRQRISGASRRESPLAQHAVRYTEPAPDRFKDFWRDQAVVVRQCCDRVVTARPLLTLRRSNYQACDFAKRLRRFRNEGYPVLWIPGYGR
jgi:hypothetical protein